MDPIKKIDTENISTNATQSLETQDQSESTDDIIGEIDDVGCPELGGEHINE